MKRELSLLFAVCVLITQFCSLCPAKIEIDADTVALWLFDEGSGDVLRDFSGKGNDGKVVAAEWVPGKFGSALKFDGIGGKKDYVGIAGSESLDLDKALISCLYPGIFYF